MTRSILGIRNTRRLAGFRRAVFSARCWAALLVLLAAGRVLADEPQVLADLDTSLFSVAFSPDGRTVAAGGADQRVYFFRLAADAIDDVERQRREALIRQLDDDRFSARQEAFVALANLGDEIKPRLEAALAQTESAEVRLRLRKLLEAASLPQGVGHRGEIRGLAFSPGGDFLASASRDDSLRIWHTATGRTVRVHEAACDSLWCVAYSADGQRLVAGGDRAIAVWNPASGELLQMLQGHKNAARAVQIHPDGQRLASAGGFDKSVRLWDFTQQRPQATFDDCDDAVLCVAYSPRGEHLVAAGYSGKLQWFSTGDKPQAIGTRPAHQGVIRGAAFSRDGKWLATAGDDRLIKLWPAGNADATEPIAILRGHNDAIHALAFSRDSKRLASAGADGQVRLWTVREQLSAADSEERR